MFKYHCELFALSSNYKVKKTNDNKYCIYCFDADEKDTLTDKVSECIKSLNIINPKFIYFSIKDNEDNLSIYTLMESKTSDFEVFEDRYKRHLSELENDLFIKKIKLL